MIETKKCPKCGSKHYEEHKELMYVKGIDDFQYGGNLENVLVQNCNNCG